MTTPNGNAFVLTISMVSAVSKTPAAPNEKQIALQPSPKLRQSVPFHCNLN